MREFTLTDMERLGAFDEAERTFQMTEEAFRTFYELTARPVRVYLARMTGDDRLADDLLQETYYRFLRVERRLRERRSSAPLPVPHRHQPGARPSPPPPCRSGRRRRFRNRVRCFTEPQRRRARRPPHRPAARAWRASSRASAACCGSPTRRAGRTKRLPPSIGVKTGSLKPMLHRARQRLAGLLKTGGRS